MATSFIFDGKTIIIPGVYSTIKSGMKNPPLALPFGNLLVIDTGSGAEYGGGAGIDGEFSKGKDSIYNFDNLADYRDFAKGGLWWLLGQPLFRPAGLGVNGVSKISFIKAATTTGARITYDFDDTEQSISGTPHSLFTIAVTDEGLIGNGVKTGTVLTKGFAGKLSAGIIDTTKFVLTFYRGTYKGLDQNSLPFDGISEATSTPLVIAQSPECSTFQELKDWMAIDYLFNKHFKLMSSPHNLAGGPTEGDYNFYSDFNLAVGGTETYVDPELLASSLTAVTDLDISFILADQYGTDAQSVANYSILAHIIETSKYKPELYIGGGDDLNTFESISIATAQYYNNDSVSVVHGGIKKQSQQGMRNYNVMYHAAAALGKEAGQEPQVPITFKGLDFDGVLHSLNDKEITKALKAGVITTRPESSGTFDITKGINTLQQNNFLVNDDGTTHSKQIKRIARQLNKEIKIEAMRQLLKDPNGVNRNTLSVVDLKAWTEKYLKGKQCTIDDDNLILSYQEINITRNQDGYFITYKFTPNSEISFLFFTGLIIGI